MFQFLWQKGWKFWNAFVQNIFLIVFAWCKNYFIHICLAKFGWRIPRLRFLRRAASAERRCRGMNCQQVLPGQEPAVELMLQCFCTIIIPFLCEYPLIVEQPCDSSVQGKSRIGFSCVAEGLQCLPLSSQWEEKQPGIVIKPWMKKSLLVSHFYLSTTLICCLFITQSPEAL